MRMRNVFSLVRPILRVGTLAFRCLPRWVALLILIHTRHLPGATGLAVRYILISRLAKICGECTAVFEGVHFKGIERLEVGDNVSIHPMCFIDAQGGIRIGHDVSIAHGVSFVSHNHDYSNRSLPIRDTPVIFAPIVIEDNVWIGCGVRVLAGVTIGSGSVVGAGAVVTRSLPPNSICVGVPARVIGSTCPVSNLSDLDLGNFKCA